MARKELESALRQIEPATMAAKVRQVMPVIEEQLRAGATHAAVREVLAKSGIVVNDRTFKTYLYRYRKTLKSDHNGASVGSELDKQEPSAPRVSENVSYDTDDEAEGSDARPTGPVVFGSLSKLMNPGEDVNAGEMARYEAAGKPKRKWRDK
nr:conjugal transfer protein TraD [Pseudomonas syringae]